MRISPSVLHSTIMPRRPRVVFPGVAHHITQRGNDRQTVFFSSDDRRFYLDLLTRHAARSGTRILGYCLMTNHVNLVAVPERENSLAHALRHAHSEYALAHNRAGGHSGHLLAEPFLFLPAGRIAPDERSALHRPQSGARGLGATALGLALVERPRPRDRRRSRSGPGPRLGRVLRPVGLPRLARNTARCCGARTRACRVDTRLYTPVGTDNMSGPGVGTSAAAARRSACATVSRPNVREKRVLARGRPKRKSGAPEDAAAQGCLFAGREE